MSPFRNLPRVKVRAIRMHRTKRPYLTPYDHAFASGPVFLRPESLAAARHMFEVPQDGELLCKIFDTFDSVAEVGRGLRLGLHSRAVSKNRGKVIRIGNDCAIRGIIRCNPGGSVKIGNTVYIGDGTILDSMSCITIGDATLLAHGVQILDNDSHPIDAAERESHFRSILGFNEGKKNFSIATEPVTIGRRCWIGFYSAIMKGVTIGDDSIVAAGSYVVKDVPSKCVVAGNPARVVKMLDDAVVR